MANNKIGCSAGRTSLVDPNNFDGQNSSSNMSVPLEDLNISVQLTTYKKGRTVLIADKSPIINPIQNTDTVSVTFVGGSQNNDGTHSLTTKYTELTTIFDDNTTKDSAETLGITNIDIDFNSSYAPMVVINFIDVRGSAIFQNEKNVATNKNNYSTFFQLPYPLFELTVKGYYGKPVKYCLHMTKFNAKFNSQTGNFEITANFIGYTYAMLSDMLIGYLKAIPYTKIGKDVYDKTLNKGRKPILFLNQLMEAISKINVDISKLASTDENNIDINSNIKKLDGVNDIENALTKLYTELDINNDKTTPSKDYIVIKSTLPPKDLSTVLPIVNNNFSDIKTLKQNINLNQTTIPTNDPIGNFINSTKDAINKINDNNLLNINDFDINNVDNKIEYRDITINELNKNNYDSNGIFIATTATVVITKDTIKQKLNNPIDLAATMADLFDYLTKTYSIDNNTPLDIYNISILFKKTLIARNEIDDDTKQLKKQLARNIKNKMSRDLKFDPSVRNIVEVFTTAVEAFLITLYRVSKSAEGHSERTTEIKKAITIGDNSDLKNLNKIYPWPDYKEMDGDKGYVEKYLGASNKITSPNNIDELAFIDDLLNGFISAAREEKQSELDLLAKTTNWIPVNPLDTRLSTNLSPYTRTELINPKDIISLILIRAMTFLGYTNFNALSESDFEKQIKPMAIAEAQLVLRDITNINLKNNLSETSLNDFLTVTRENPLFGNTSQSKVIDLANSNNKYFYNYIFPSAIPTLPQPYEFRILPVYQLFFNDKWTPVIGLVNNPTELLQRGVDNVFLSNYSDGVFPKPDNGSKFIKIYSKSEYTDKKFDLVDKTINTTNTLLLDKISIEKIVDLSAAGFNVFGGGYGIQEFENLDYGVPSLSNLLLKFVFYNKTSNFDAWFNGLGYSRETSISPTVVYDYDYDTSNFLEIPSYSDVIINTTIDNWETHDSFGNNLDIFNNTNRVKTYPYINITSFSGGFWGKYMPFSLFGSKLYYGQKNTTTTSYNQALLFLGTLPWNRNPFDAPEIKHLFDTRGGFIHIPRLWCAYVGGLLWRNDLTSSITNNAGFIIGGGSGPTDPILWSAGTIPLVPGFSTDSIAPPRDYFLRMFNPNPSYQSTESFNHILRTIPDQVKNEFKKIFFEFVNGFNIDTDVNGNVNNEYTSWKMISTSLEIWSGDGISLNTEVINIITTAEINSLPTKPVGVNSIGVLKSDIENNFINYSNYKIITPIYDKNNDYSLFKGNMFLEIKGDYNTPANTYSNGVNPIRTIIDAMSEEVIIANAYPVIWGNGKKGLNNSATGYQYEEIAVDKKILEDYINTMIGVFKGFPAADKDEKKQLEQETFGSSDEKIIKFQLYRTCKNIYDKWLGGVHDENKIVFQCGNGTRHDTDTQMAINLGRDANNLRLIDSFRFVTRSFRDIGDELYINPVPINTYLHTPNSSFYDAVSSLLSANNFDFIALPSYINYNNPELVKTIFDTVQYEDALKEGICGPSFVCVYVGQKSKNLDFKGSEYTNDGFDIQCTNGSMSVIPKDLTTPAEKYENNVTVFAVNYSQQNQNIFKDITLDQNEFTETAESLQIIDDISKMGSENNRTYAGQNMYNVYSVRSYKAEVEMMGNAMIQPMMYFQLNNIPMFHGAYMITHVKHNIKPNYMSTHFTGVRIRSAETQIIDAIDMYQSLIDSVDTSIASSAATPQRTIGRQLGIGYSSYKYGLDGSNNPGNLRPTTNCGIPSGVKGFKGCASTSKAGDFIEFKDILYGMQAGLQIKRNSIGRSKIIADGYRLPRKTLLTYLLRYAPPNENDTNGYINDIGNALKKLDPTFTWVTLLKLNHNFTTSGGGLTSNNYQELVKITTSGNTFLEPGAGGSDLTSYVDQYENSKGQDETSYQFLKRLTAAQWQKESSAGTLINLIDKEQYWILWENTYDGNKNVLKNWGIYGGNQYINKMFLDIKNITNNGRPDVGTWKAEIPKEYWYQ